MKNNRKLFTLAALTSAATGVIYLINKFISSSSLIEKTLDKPHSNSFYKWRFGNIYYKKTGNGEPLILVHDLIPGGSGFEWHKIENQLAKKYTVYALDLLGCARSEKPAITYTNFIYSQLLCDFTRNVIGCRSSIVASGLSSSFAISACNIDNDLFDTCILINPTSLCKLNQIPNNNSKSAKLLVEFPVIGTMLYNIFSSMFHVEHLFMEEYFHNPFHIDNQFMEAYHEAAHMGDGAGKYLYASLIGRYLNFNIQHSLKSINNSIYIIAGKKESDIEKTIEEYQKYNPSIESIEIENSKHFPHIEQTEIFLKNIELYLNNEEI